MFMTVKELQTRQTELLAGLERASSVHDLEAFKLAHLVRKGSIAALFDDLKNVPKEIKPEVGKALNELRTAVEEKFKEKESSLGGSGTQAAEHLDLTMPARPIPVSEPGHIHPLTKTLDE